MGFMKTVENSALMRICRKDLTVPDNFSVALILDVESYEIFYCLVPNSIYLRHDCV